ncbi:hypothetical protein TNCV_1968441 [Trichonephila clavipes]|nr:hypothetical protein TNCV_1968441 [Trichonephila clavipes]
MEVDIKCNENANKLVKEARNLNNDNIVNVTLIDANAVMNFKLRDKSIFMKHQICDISGDHVVTKTFASLRTEVITEELSLIETVEELIGIVITV